MKIYIDDSIIVKDIKKEFSKAYPFLKIEFFRHPHNMGKTSPKEEMVDAMLPVSEIRTNHETGYMDISRERTVAALENDFWQQFGLSVQVFRKSGYLWIETSLTDSWTLARQNEEGFQLSDAMHGKTREEKEEDRRIDYD
jgi:hypothetical protein